MYLVYVINISSLFMKNHITVFTNSIPNWFRILFTNYFLFIFFSLFTRIFSIVYVYDGEATFFDKIVLNSLLIGLQFDNVIASYIAVLPFLLLFIFEISNIKYQITNSLISFYYTFISSIIIFITFADIPYFKFFRNRLSEASFQWIDSPKIVFEMIITNIHNLFFLIITLIFIIITVILLYKYLKNRINKIQERKSVIKNFLFCFLTILLIFMGMRGKQTHPIRVDDAIYCSDPVLNQVGLNPLFTIIKSYMTKANLMPEKEAFKMVNKLLNINQPIPSISPIARKVISDSNSLKPNVVLVLMESMSANYMSKFGNKSNLTPFLDSLSKHSWFFTNAYSAGIHTNNGIFSTLYSFPAIKRVRPMNTMPIRKYSGLPKILKQNNYCNIFFSTHDKSFDNLMNFIPNNYFDKLYTSDDYPKEKIIGPFGIPDDFLFSYAVSTINKLPKQKPFFATLLTTSNHDPYLLPKYFKSKLSNKNERAVSYADWSLNKFMKSAQNQDWFENTIFIFVSDHGRHVGKSNYEISLSYNHIPILFYSPKYFNKPKEINSFIGQIDVFPTIAGILKLNYINNTLGENVLKNPRDCIYFNTDDKLACINDSLLYIYSFSGNEVLYKYKSRKLIDYKKLYSNELKNLREKAFSQTQVAQSIFSKNLTKTP